MPSYAQVMTIYAHTYAKTLAVSAFFRAITGESQALIINTLHNEDQDI